MRVAPEEGPCVTGLVKRLKRLRTIVAIFLLAAAGPVLAQDNAAPSGQASGDPMSARLSAEKVGDVETGSFSTGDNNLAFSLQPYGERYLLRFTDSPEEYVLTVERVLLGGRILRYDTGVAALRVSVWGGMTLYTQDAPQGLPATYQGVAPAPDTLSVSAGELQTAFGDEASHLIYVQNIAIKFSADPAVLSADAETRGRAFDALTNAATGIERFLAANSAAHRVLAKRINSVKVAEGGKPTITISGQTCW